MKANFLFPWKCKFIWILIETTLVQVTKNIFPKWTRNKSALPHKLIEAVLDGSSAVGTDYKQDDEDHWKEKSIVHNATASLKAHRLKYLITS